ncbi:hypothetical protein V7157_19985 [Neobacillus drentensis]|uniref:hypothetical protein n=1 Tax=Neobacillus drentensis TaxID=220684 RepID=UPI0030037F1F
MPERLEEKFLKKLVIQMKIKENLILFLVPIIALLAIILRLTHTISSSSFGLMGLILAFLGFVRTDYSKKEVHPFVLFPSRKDLNERFKPSNYVVGCIIIIGIFYVVIGVFSFFGQL